MDMYDSQLAFSMASSSSIGLAQHLVQQVTNQGSTNQSFMTNKVSQAVNEINHNQEIDIDNEQQR